ncbi:TrmB family transcriptional regulator [Bacteroidota bacterium]
MDIKVLEEIGLSKNEIKIYFALLELDQASATPIVKKSGIPNSKVYPTLEKLIQKGLVSFVVKNRVKYFQASEPENFLDLLEKKEVQINQQKETIKALIPEIKKRRETNSEKQEATVYEGIKGVKAAFDEILSNLESGNKYYVFTLGNELEKVELKSFFRNFHAKRVRKNITVNFIANTSLKKVFQEHHDYKKMSIKYSDQTFPSGIFIFANKVMTVVWCKKPTAFVITSKNNYDRYKEFFEESWKNAKK